MVVWPSYKFSTSILLVFYQYSTSILPLSYDHLKATSLTHHSPLFSPHNIEHVQPWQGVWIHTRKDTEQDATADVTLNYTISILFDVLCIAGVQCSMAVDTQQVCNQTVLTISHQMIHKWTMHTLRCRETALGQLVTQKSCDTVL